MRAILAIIVVLISLPLVLSLRQFLPSTPKVEAALSVKVDPASIRSIVDVASLFSLVGQDLSRLSSLGRWGEVDAVAKELLEGDFPPELKPLVEQLNPQLRELAGLLQQISSSLARIAELVPARLVNKANEEIVLTRQRLDQADSVYRELDFSLQSMAVQARPLLQAIGLPVDAADVKARSVSSIFADVLFRYRRLLDLQEAALRTLSANLLATGIEVTARKTHVEVGERAHLFGVLRMQQKALPQRQLQVLVANTAVTTVSTNAMGEFEADFSLPNPGDSPFPVKVRFVPQGEDTRQFRGSETELFMTTTLHATPVELEAPSRALRGRDFPVVVRFGIPGLPAIRRQVTLYVNEELYASAEGEVEVTFAVNLLPGVVPASYGLEARVTPVEIRKGGVAAATTEVDMVAPRISLQLPRLLIAGQRLKIRGMVDSSAGAVQGAPVHLRAGDIDVVATTGADGAFETVVAIPVTEGLTGLQRVEARLDSSYPWLRSGAAEGTTVVFGIGNMGLTILGLVVVGLTLRHTLTQRPRRLPPTVEGGIVAGPSQIVSGTTASPQSIQSQPLYKLDRQAAQMLEAYKRAAAAVTAFTGVSLRASVTVREFFAATREKLGGVAADFHWVTTRIEATLYGPGAPLPEEVEEARARVNRLEEALR